eukprot:2851699-Pleurochrysis_carterae.AAC.1
MEARHPPVAVLPSPLLSERGTSRQAHRRDPAMIRVVSSAHAGDHAGEQLTAAGSPLPIPHSTPTKIVREGRGGSAADPAQS